MLAGFQKETLKELAGLVTVYGTGPVNLNTAPAPVLTRLGLSASLADQVVAFRLGQDGKWGTQDDGVFVDVEQIIPTLENRLGSLPPEDRTVLGNLISSQRIGVRSSYYQVEVEGWTQADGIHTKVITVMERVGANTRPILRGLYEI